MAKKKKKHRLKDFFSKQKEHFKKVKKKIHDNLKKIHFPSKEERKYMTLLPFKHVMSKALDKKGIKHTGKLNDIAPKFLQHAIGKKAVFANHLSGGSIFEENENFSFDEIHPIFFNGEKDHFDFSDEENFNADGDEGDDSSGSSDANSYVDTAKKAGGIIKRILAWFRERKARKQAEKLAKENANHPTPTTVAEVKKLDPTIENPDEVLTALHTSKPITPDEDEILDDADKVQKVVISAAEKEVQKDEEAGFLGTGYSPVQIIIGLAVVTAIISFAMKGKAKT